MMNKLTILAVFACLGLARASDSQEIALLDDNGDDYSQLSLMPSDDVEISYLQGENKIFADFCIQSRDEVRKFLRESTNGAAAGVFNVMFNSIGDIGSDLVRAQKEAIEEGATLIRSNAVMQPGTVASPEQVKKELEETVENVSLAKVVSDAAKVVVNAVIETIQTQVFERLALLRQHFTADTFKERVGDACQSISYTLRSRLESKLAAAKREIKRSGGNPMDSVKLENVGCLTTGRIAKVSKLCDVFRLAGSTIYPLLGL